MKDDMDKVREIFKELQLKVSIISAVTVVECQKGSSQRESANMLLRKKSFHAPSALMQKVTGLASPEVVQARNTGVSGPASSKALVATSCESEQPPAKRLRITGRKVPGGKR